MLNQIGSDSYLLFSMLTEHLCIQVLELRHSRSCLGVGLHQNSFLHQRHLSYSACLQAKLLELRDFVKVNLKVAAREQKQQYDTNQVTTISCRRPNLAIYSDCKEIGSTMGG